MEDYARLEQLTRVHGSPLYLFDGEKLRTNFLRIREAFERRWPRFIIGYSYKTNYIPYLCRMVRDMGGWAEVVSGLEYDLALEIGQDPRKIIFNGPLKSAEEIERCLAGGGLLNLDGLNEVQSVLDFARRHPERTVGIGLRINMNLTDPQGRSHVQEGFEAGRFGMGAEALAEAVSRLAKASNVRVISLHGHTSSSTREVWIYERIAATLCALAQERFPECEYINIGGGIYGNVPPVLGLGATPDFNDYAEGICKAILSNPWFRERRPHLVLEPGVSMAADTLEYVTKVVEVKRMNGRTLAVVDGSALHIKPSLHRRTLPFRVISQGGETRGGDEVLSIAGSTCMEKDYLVNDVVARLERGDIVHFSHVGAYSVVMSPPFIHPGPAIVAREGEDYRRIRRRQNLRDIFGVYFEGENFTGGGGEAL